MHYKEIHKDFTLNGKHFANENDLLIYTKGLSSSIFSFLQDWFDDANFIRVKTSGSTGEPKDIKLEKVHMINSALATSTYFNLPSKTEALLCLSTGYIAGKMMLVRAITLGWYLDITEPSTNPLEGIDKTYDFSAMVPLQAYNSLNKLSQIKKLIIGGGVVSKELEGKLQDVSTEVYATYGMTETITHIAVKKINNQSLRGGTTKQSEEINRQITSPLKADRNDVFFALPNISISKDKRNRLVINAPKVSDELVITNDLVEIISNTEFKWLGRYDNIINSGGIKLIPEQIEKKLSAIINRRFFVAGIPDEVLGEKLALIVEGDEDRIVISNKVRNLSSLTKYEVPKEIYFVPKFIETETKKIQRQQTLDLIFNKK